VGTYAVPAITAVGGGQFTLNVAGKNWTELMAAQLGLPAPCAAFTGGYGTAANATPKSGCYGYAQGGARVFSQPGIGYTGTIAGALTYPVAQQISSHLTAVGGSFSGSEVVFVLAGANDILIEAQVAYPGYVAACMGAGMTGCAGGGLTASAAQTAALQIALGDVTGVADLLVNQITTNITGKGAKYVVVVNVPDIANTPLAVGAGSSAQQLFDAFVTTFNAELKTQLASNANVLLVDAYTANRDEVTNPAAYGLTNVTGTACNVTGAFLTTNFLTSSGHGSSLGCSIANPASLTAGVTADTHYLFADDVHPTPYGYLQLARLISRDMLIKGWL
jgi:phospholipase/lecithinase/hemolysin